MIGTKIAHFEITALLGSGGMGEVYRATDTKLGRSVAIKVLPDSFTHDVDRLARFEREARVLASLNHPQIAAIYGLEESAGQNLLVMELVEGETLADRIARGPIPIDEALPIAKQICEALEAANERGIVHRDLKPGNVKITPERKVKVLDFGLAKAIQGPTSNTEFSNSPTLVPDGTSTGLILGTAAYMSPEQAKGLKTDRRSDVFSFGCVLYEMLTGHPAFNGDAVSEILASVLKSEPDWRRLPQNLYPRIADLLRRLLQKDKDRRLHDIADARIEIEEALNNPALAAASVGAQTKSSKRTVFLSAMAGVAIAVAVSTLYVTRSDPPQPAEVRLEVNTPPTSSIALSTSFAISPDGRKLVFSGLNEEGQPQLWIRPLDSIAAQPLSGTVGSFFPFWSPDSASIGFFADNKLKRVEVAGGAPQVLASGVAGRGGSWNRDGTIIFALAAGPLLKVAATGGEPQAITQLKTGQSFHGFPKFLPDGQHFVYFEYGEDSGLYLGSLAGIPAKRIAATEGPGLITPSGFLLFLRQNTLFAQAFDSAKQELTGSAFPFAQEVAFDGRNGRAPGFSATSNVVAYRRVMAGAQRQLTWLSRSGQIIGNLGSPQTDLIDDIELSPDEKHVAVNRTINGNIDVWIFDTVRGIPVRFTFDVKGEQRPVWSPDGKQVVFQANRTGVPNLYAKASSGGGADELLLASNQIKVPNDWSPDGRFLLFRSTDPQTGFDLWVLPMFGDKKPFPFLKTVFEEREGQFSPDGKWVAYQSREAGRFEIYVQPFPANGAKFQVSTDGGTQVRWNKNGKEIFYVSLDNKMMAAPVNLSSDGKSLDIGTPAALFPVRIGLSSEFGSTFKQQYAVSSDGQRFLVNLALDDAATSPITMILNWRPEPGK